MCVPSLGRPGFDAPRLLLPLPLPPPPPPLLLLLLLRLDYCASRTRWGCGADTATYSYHAAKGHPLSSYGEDYFNCFQAAVVSYQVLAYQGRLASRTVQLVGLALYAVVVGVLVNLRKLVGAKSADRILGVLMSAATCIFITARWPQIILNFRNRGVGQLNIATTLLYFFGNCIRLYTTATQLGYDALTMTSSSCSARELPR